VRHRLYLVGYPLGHTLSPQIHNSYFAKMNLPLTYEKREVAPGRFAEEVKALFAEPAFLGANFTSPFKQQVVELVDGLEADAAEIGAVNTVVRRTDGSIIGHNTDVGGFAAALRVSGKERVRGAVVFGTGGAALAVICALGRLGCERFVVIHRSERNLSLVRKLVSSFGKHVRLVKLSHFNDFFSWAEREGVFGNRWGISCGGNDAMEAVSRGTGVCTDEPGNANSEGFDRGPKQYDLLVNATPIGLHPRAEEAIADHPRFFHLFKTVADLVYNPVQTKLLFLAQLHGCDTVNGRLILEQQAALSRDIWLREFAAGVGAR